MVVAGNTELLDQVLIRNPDLRAARKALFNFNELLNISTPPPPAAPANDPPTSSPRAKRSRTHTLITANTDEEQHAILPSPADMSPDDDREVKRARQIAAAEERRRRESSRGIGDQEVVDRMQRETTHQTRTRTSQLFGASRALSLRQAKDALKRKQEAEKEHSTPSLSPAELPGHTPATITANDLQETIQVPPSTKRQRVTSTSVSATSVPATIIDDAPVHTPPEPVSLPSSATIGLCESTAALDIPAPSSSSPLVASDSPGHADVEDQPLEIGAPAHGNDSTQLRDPPDYDAALVIGYDTAPQAIEDNTRCGLNNLGNTCYANSVVNALAKIPRVRYWLSQHLERLSHERDHPPRCLLCVLARDISRLTTFTENDSFNPIVVQRRREWNDGFLFDNASNMMPMKPS